MLKQLQKRKENQGFTIIEVLIVLAIAGLILVVVFLAVPALQRSQRNNGRASEASRFSSAVANFTSNNQGNVPSSQNDAISVLTDFGATKYLQTAGGATLSAPATTSGKMTKGQVNFVTGAITTGTPVTAGQGDAVVIDAKATCGPPSTAMTTGPGTNRQVALIYTTESSGASYNQVCIQAE